MTDPIAQLAEQAERMAIRQRQFLAAKALARQFLELAQGQEMGTALMAAVMVQQTISHQVAEASGGSAVDLIVRLAGEMRKLGELGG